MTLPLPRPLDCPKAYRHTRARMPDGYLARHAWAERMQKRYRQTRCDECGYWVIWRRRP